MASVMMDKVNIVPLNEKNFATWKIQIKMTLIKEGLWGLVTGTEVAPTENGALAKYNTRKDRALATIVMAIQPSLLYLVGDPTDPQVVYEKLRDTFQKKTWSNKLRLRKSLYGMKLLPGMNVHQLLKSFVEIFEELSIIGEAVDNEDKVIHLLASLPDEYSTLVTALEAQDNIPSWEIVQEKLLHEENKLKLKTASDNIESALNNNVKRFKKTFKCYECGKSGHIKKNCKVFLNKLKASSSSNANMVNTAEVSDLEYDSCGLISVLSACDVKYNSWVIDSGATRHMCNSVDKFDKLIDLKFHKQVKVGDGRSIKAIGIGTVTLHVDTGISGSFKLCNVLYVPELSYNLLSVAQILNDDKTVNFHNNVCDILSKNGDIIVSGNKTGDLYQVIEIPLELSCISDSVSVDSTNIWHRRFCHLNNDGMHKLIRENLVDGINDCKFTKLDFCEPCVNGKNHRLPFPKKSLTRATKPLELIHSDVCGKVSVPSLSGNNYFVTFIDDCTRFVWAYPIKTKDEVFDKFKCWKTIVEKQIGMKIKTFRSDNGGEYLSNMFKKFFQVEGIKHETTVPHTPEQNGVSERMNRSLVEAVRTMLHDSNLGKIFWAEALATAVYIRNRCPTSALVLKTPFEGLYGKKPNVKHLRIFGCTAYGHIPKQSRGKLDSKSIKCIFLGYSSLQKGYRLYDPIKNKVVICRDVIFDESNFASFQKEFENNVNINPNPCIELPISIPTDEVTQDVPRRSVRNRRPPDRYGDWACITKLEDDPLNFQDAINSASSTKWKEAMQEEIKSMATNDVWNLTELPEGREVIKSKWLFKKKLDAEGNVSKYKARLVARGFDQRYGIDYDETFSPVARFESIRMIMALSVQLDLHLHHMDVASAFLNGELKEDVYMTQPEGYIVKGNESLVCKLNRSIYGLKQAPRCWNASLDKVLKELNFIQSNSDPCIYTNIYNNELFILAVYVDDIILACKSINRINEFKGMLMTRYKMTDLDELNYFLGVKVDQINNNVFLSQKAYALRIMEKFGLTEANPVKTPIEPNLKLNDATSDDKLFDAAMYQSAVGCLLYLSTKTRPDISYAVGKAARFCSKPMNQHWLIVKRILRYVKGTIDFGLLYSKCESPICIGYSDSDWAGDSGDRKSTSGYTFQMSGASVSWNSCKQSCVALSTAEAEYVALSKATQEAVWLRQFLSGIHPDSAQPMTINEDNQAAISISNDFICSKKTKHIDIKFHFVRDQINKNVIKLKYCCTDSMIADILTKGLTPDKFLRFRKMLGVVSL